MMAFAFLTIRLLAIYLVVKSLSDLMQVASMWPMFSDQAGPITATLPLILTLFSAIAGIALWFAAVPLARLAQLPGKLPDDYTEINTNDWTRLVIVVFGLYLIVTSIPSMASLLVLSYQQSNVTAETSIMDMITGDRSNWSQITYSGTRFLLGVVMVIGRSGVVRFVYFLRNFALGSKSPPNQSSMDSPVKK